MAENKTKKDQALSKVKESHENLRTCEKLIEKRQYEKAIQYAWLTSEKALKSLYLLEGGKESDVVNTIVYKHGLMDILTNLQKYPFSNEVKREIEEIETAFENIGDSTTFKENEVKKVFNNSKKVVSIVESYINNLKENDQ